MRIFCGMPFVVQIQNGLFSVFTFCIQISYNWFGHIKSFTIFKASKQASKWNEQCKTCLPTSILICVCVWAVELFWWIYDCARGYQNKEIWWKRTNFALHFFTMEYDVCIECDRHNYFQVLQKYYFISWKNRLAFRFSFPSIFRLKGRRLRTFVY